jgi:aryl-alcohol dehydrogenase-like predicted oxidoreductase
MIEAPTLLLGSAMWGWTTPKTTAFALLDEWYGQGFREVDAAANYPIDKDPAHFRLSENMLLEWLKTHEINDLRVVMKIGSVNNLRTPEHVLTKSFVLMMLDEYGWKFGNNLATLMVHWDNRDDADAIRDTLEAFEVARSKGLQVGLSGIRHPEIYASGNAAFGFDFRIQLKHNVLQSDYDRYAPFHGKRRFIAYGINAGGLKLEKNAYSAQSSLAARGGDVMKEPPVLPAIRAMLGEANRRSDRPPLTAFHQVGMIYAFYQPDMQGILLGASGVDQLRESIEFYQTLQAIDYQDVYEAMILISDIR